MESKDTTYTIEELKEKMAEVFKEASRTKYEIRFTFMTEDELIELSEGFAEMFDDVMDEIIEQHRDFYDDYRAWFDYSYEKESSYRSGLMFKDIEMSGVGDYKDGVMRYFNYIIENVILINHLIMSLEFSELYNQCTTEEEVE